MNKIVNSDDSWDGGIISEKGWKKNIDFEKESNGIGWTSTGNVEIFFKIKDCLYAIGCFVDLSFWVNWQPT